MAGNQHRMSSSPNAGFRRGSRSGHRSATATLRETWCVPVYEPPSRTALSWALASCGVRPGGDVTVERLVGGITADVDRIVIRDSDGRHRRVVLRRWTSVEPWTHGLVEREAGALRALADQDVYAPHLLGADPTGDRAGVRCLLMTEVAGEVVLAPADLTDWIDRLASTQTRIHQVAPTLPDRAEGWFTPDTDFGWITDAGLRRDAVAAAREPVSGEQTVLVHGDYQHFNVLWTGERVSGVVDWTMAGTGPLGTDVGHCRLNLAVLISARAAETYLERYERRSGIAVDPRADLRALLCWNPSWLEFIPRQIAGRAPVDLNGMAGRVVGTIRHTLSRLG
jgi:aminoglycoside phosphotransferase